MYILVRIVIVVMLISSRSASAKLDKGDTRLKLLEDNVNIFVPMIQKSLLMVSMVILYFHLIQSIL